MIQGIVASERAQAPSPSGAAWRRQRRALVAVLAGLPLGIVACGSGPKAKAARLSGSIVAAPDLNPSVSDRPSPLVVRIFELRAATAFNQADFLALYQADQATLGAELLAREELVLQPGETRPYQRQLSADTRFLGVLGAYRDLERAVWRSVVPVQAGGAQRLTLRADRLALTLTIQP
jgi:type VI secretion system protein VasD